MIMWRNNVKRKGCAGDCGATGTIAGTWCSVQRKRGRGISEERKLKLVSPPKSHFSLMGQISGTRLGMMSEIGHEIREEQKRARHTMAFLK